MPIRARHSNGKFAIYTVPTLSSTDDAPLTDPDNNASRLRFHSDREYIPITSVVTGSIILPAQGANLQVKNDYAIIAHGKSSAPLVFGSASHIRNTSAPTGGTVPLCGSIAIPRYAPDGGIFSNDPLPRWLSLTVDDTYVYIREYGFTRFSAYMWPPNAPVNQQTAYFGWDAIQVNYTVWITDFLLDGPTSLANPAKPLMRMDATSVSFGRGKFDSQNRYLRRSATSNEIIAPRAPHISYESSSPPGSNSHGYLLKSQVANYSFDTGFGPIAIEAFTA